MAALQSHIRINFGDKSHAHTPVNLQFQATFFSTQQNILKEQIATRIGEELTQTFFAFELIPKPGSAEDLSNQLNNSDVIKQIKQVSPTSVTFYPINDKVYAILKGQQISYSFEQIKTVLNQNKIESHEDTQKIKLKIRSQNDLGRIAALLKDRAARGWFDSLQIELVFTKTQLNTRILIAVLENVLGIQQVSAAVNAFKNVNFELNLASSGALEEFKNLKPSGSEQLPKNQLAAILASAEIEYAKFYAFNPIVFLQGRLALTGLSSLLQSIYKQ